MDAVRRTFPETNEFIDSTVKEECEKEKITADEVILLLLNLQKKEISLDKLFCFRFGPIVIIFLVYRCGRVWQIVKRRNVYQKKR